jgi:enoyl-CoA hydratase/carnithine racemase
MADTQPDQPDELVHYEVADRIATITLDSPRNRNALSRQLITELFERLDRADEDADVLAVVLRSSGRVFCSGADLSEASTTPMEEGARAIVTLQRRIVGLSKPVVTVVAGAARAGGIGIVAASDIVLTAENATFALTEVKLGLAPAVISLTVFPRLTQRAAALTALGGEVFTGTEAVAMGLVTRAVPAEQLDAAVAELCGQLSTSAAQGLRETKKLLSADLLERIDTHGEELVALSAGLFGSDEAREAMIAFLNRKSGALG